jgi:hypothetical protein
MYIGSHVKNPLLLSDFNETNFLHNFSKNSRISNFMNVCPVGAELLHADRRTEEQMGRYDKANRRFSKFSNAPENVIMTA